MEFEEVVLWAHRTPHEQKNALPVEPQASATFFGSMNPIRR